MARNNGISFLYEFDLGNRLFTNFGSNIIRTTSAAVGDFAPGNITTESTRQRWRSANVLVEHEIVIQAELRSEIDTFAILGHNFTPGAIVRVQANIDDVWIAPPFDQQVVVDPEVPNIVVANDGFGAEYEFYRVTILDPTNPCNFLEIGRIIGGRAFTFDNFEDITDDFSIAYTDQSESIRTQGYFRASNENVEVRSFSANFSKHFSIQGQNRNLTEFRRLRRKVRTTRPFLTILDRDMPTTFNVWGQFTSLPNESFTVLQFVSYPVTIEEVF